MSIFDNPTKITDPGYERRKAALQKRIDEANHKAKPHTESEFEQTRFTGGTIGLGHTKKPIKVYGESNQ